MRHQSTGRAGRKRLLAAAATTTATCALITAAAPPTRAATTAQWLTAGGGDWETPANWSTNPHYPNNGMPVGTTYDAVIGATGAPYAVSMFSSNVTVDTLAVTSADAILFRNAGELRVLNGVTLANGGTIRLYSAATSGPAVLKTPAVVGAGVVAFDSHPNFSALVAPGNELVVGNGVTIRSDTGSGDIWAQTMTNEGVISAETAGREIELTSMTFNNAGTVRAHNGGLVDFDTFYSTRTFNNSGWIDVATGGTLQLLGTGVTLNNTGTITVDAAVMTANRIDNAGSFSARNGATVTFGNGWSNSSGTMTFENSSLTMTMPGGPIGNLDATGSDIHLSGDFSTVQLAAIDAVTTRMNVWAGTLDNTGQTLTIDPATTKWRLTGGTINGGTISAVAGAVLEAARGIPLSFSMSTLSDVNLQADVAVGNGMSLSLVNTPLDGRTIRLAGATADTALRIPDSQVATGANTVIFDGNDMRRNYVGATAGALHLPKNMTVTSGTGSGNVGDAAAPTVIAGTVTATGAGRRIDVLGSTVTNSGQLSAGDGGTLRITGTWTNNGTIAATGGAHLQLGGAAAAVGSVAATDSTVELLSTYTTDQVNLISRTRSDLAVLNGGTLDNTGRTLTLDPAAGGLRLRGGRLRGGTVNGPATVLLETSGSIIDGVTFGTDLHVSVFSSVMNGLTLDGGNVIFGGTNPQLATSGTQTIGGTGEIIFNSASSPSIRPDATLTIGPNVTVRSGTSGGTLPGSTNTPNGQLILQGMISAQTAGRSVAVSVNSITNDGVMEARNGGTLSVIAFGNLTNYSSNTLTGGTFAAYAGSTLTLSGATVLTNAADIILSGAGSTFNAVNGLQQNAGSFTVTSGRGFTTAGAFTQQSGTLNIGAGSTFTSSGAFTWSGGTIEGAGAIIAPSANVTANVSRTGGGTTRFDALTIADGKRLDLANGKLITREPIGAAGADGVYDGVQGQLQSAYNYSAWDGPGIATSMPDAGPTIGITTLAINTADDTFYAGGTFGGVSVSSGDVLVMYTYAGDVNLDGIVDAADYGVIDNWIQFAGTSGYANGDFNYDGVIDAADYGIIDNSIQLQGPPIPVNAGVATSWSAVTAVPEPSAFAVALAFAASAMTRRRRRHERGQRS